MIVRFVTFLIGFGLMVIGFMYIILYLNLISVGYSYNEYLGFITTRFECYFSLIGLILVTSAIYYKESKDVD